MPPEVSLVCSQQPATCLCPEPDESSPLIPSYFFAIYFNIILSSTSVSYKLSLSCFRTETLRAHLLSAIRATWPADPINLDLKTQKIFGMRSTFPSHSDLDLFIVPVIQKETCRYSLLCLTFAISLDPSFIALPCIATPKGAPHSPTMTSPPTCHKMHSA